MRLCIRKNKVTLNKLASDPVAIYVGMPRSYDIDWRICNTFKSGSTEKRGGSWVSFSVPMNGKEHVPTSAIRREVDTLNDPFWTFQDMSRSDRASALRCCGSTSQGFRPTYRSTHETFACCQGGPRLSAFSGSSGERALLTAQEHAPRPTLLWATTTRWYSGTGLYSH